MQISKAITFIFSCCLWVHARCSLMIWKTKDRDVIIILSIQSNTRVYSNIYTKSPHIILHYLHPNKLTKTEAQLTQYVSHWIQHGVLSHRNSGWYVFITFLTPESHRMTHSVTAARNSVKITIVYTQWFTPGSKKLTATKQNIFLSVKAITPTRIVELII